MQRVVERYSSQQPGENLGLGGLNHIERKENLTTNIYFLD